MSVSAEHSLLDGFYSADSKLSDRNTTSGSINNGNSNNNGGSKSGSVLGSSTTYCSDGQLDDVYSSSSHIHDSDTQFDSSTDDTVIHNSVGNRFSGASSDRFDPEASPKSYLSRYTRRTSGDTEQCGTLYEETVNVEIDHVMPTKRNSKAMTSADDRRSRSESTGGEESERLVKQSDKMDKAGRGSSLLQANHKSLSFSPFTKADYRAGSCYHCLVSVPVGSLLSWLIVFIATIGWATTTWLGISKGKTLMSNMPIDEGILGYDEIALIAISIATVLITSVYLVIATFSSQKMSRYAFSTSKKNTFGYCLSITVIVFTFLCVLFWTLMLALTMVPVAVLSILHFLVGVKNYSCIHLESFGRGVFDASNNTISSTADVRATCDKDLDNFMEDAWRVFVPLLLSLAFSALIESAMLGFMVAASSNARHLKERMEYINEPYTYSSDNINGSVKPITKDAAPSNNNQSDTQI